MLYRQYPHRFPDILEPKDLAIMRGAVSSAARRLDFEGATVHKEAIAKVVLDFYRNGLVDPQKLNAAVLLFAHSRLLANPSP